jgi:hypothetical protein
MRPADLAIRDGDRSRVSTNLQTPSSGWRRELQGGETCRPSARVIVTWHAAPPTVPSRKASIRLALDLDEVKQAGDTPRPLAATLRSRRERARSLDRATVLPPGFRSGRAGGEIQGLAFHRAVAARLDPQMVSDARRRLRRWRERGSIDERWAREWEDVLTRPLADISRAIKAEDARGHDLRQNSPFSGALSHEERQRVMELVAEAT